MQILPLQLFIMKHSISHSPKGSPYSMKHALHSLKKTKPKQTADVTKLVANNLHTRETGMLPPSLI